MRLFSLFTLHPSLFFLHDFSIHERDPSLRARGDGGIVRDQDDRLVVRGELFEDGDDVGAGFLIEVAGRLVREDERWIVDQRTGDGDALALATRELFGTMLRALLQADALERFERALTALFA